MAARTEVSATLRQFDLGDTQADFVGLLSEGYTALEAASKLNLSRGTVKRIERVLML
jgi:DNA-binding NarL/FixJ family response regulator